MLQESLGNSEGDKHEKNWDQVEELSVHADVAGGVGGGRRIPDLLQSPTLSAAVGVVIKRGVQQQCASSGSSGSGSCVSGGSSVGMDEPISCDLSLAVDCTLSLGSSTLRPDIPARLSRAGSPAQDLTWSLSVRSEPADAPTRRTCEPDMSEQGMSWGGSCSRSEPDVTPEYYPQVTASDRGARGEDTARRGGGSKAWARSCAQAFKDEVNPSKGLLSMIENHAYDSRSGRQSWLPNYLSSSPAAEGKATSRVERCMQEGNNNFVRVCAHCGTSKTPLWRNGPQGPKSLCNACGIRFKKAGRRSAANGSSELQSSPPPTVRTAKVGKRKLDDDLDQQYWVYPSESKPRKRSRGTLLRASDSILSGGSCMTWQSCLLTSTPKSSLQRDSRVSPIARSQEKKIAQMGGFSTDEEEGAVLLMALSCGVVHA